ncbi:TPA: DUF2913 family protein [Enterobacter hormaechei subsp. steigerwaltii]|nr:DUF2913 family protein [Enterobacter hormaechei subsp. steigerwaltii]HBC0021996.1 DUF2913 family protein [Enterobacter hormaechei subsp. steigerwaltii]
MHLIRAVDSLISAGWENASLTSNESYASVLQTVNGDSAFFVCKSALTDSFSETGDLISPVDFLVYGNVEMFINIFRSYQLKTEQKLSSASSPNQEIVRLAP